ncbi:hypothetical protein LZ575_13545 [Antarcticibacterium sp. 1MA-6-2]|uniref:hypothetical protein n=1 Tax=Antarcticibacterium sp. 1MA-6-2 TaxID=2908210 RepID=UPI001F2D8804|nr:hypothetical protein [Antarcticibacterium sp. 1MA-6-2]UJH89976.1 hypothetical protein LZ575_13545 [Antarcticibacterium sp. 1MA-6-2]
MPFQPERPKQLSGNKLLIGYRGTINPDSLKIEPISSVPENFEYKFTKVPDKDSLHVWTKPLLEMDSIRFKLIAPNRTDTLFTRINKMPADTLLVNTEPSGNLDFNSPVVFKPSTPIEEFNEDLITLINKDSLSVEFSSEVRPDNSVALRFPKDENQTYNLLALPGTITDIYGSTSDTIKKSFKTRPFADFANLTVNLQNVKSYPVIVQLTDEKGAVKAEKYSTGESSLRFEFLTPGKYLLRAIYDVNENGKWDTGNYLEKRKPEEIIYLPEPLDIRPNWDMTEPFSL